MNKDEKEQMNPYLPFEQNHIAPNAYTLISSPVYVFANITLLLQIYPNVLLLSFLCQRKE